MTNTRTILVVDDDAHIRRSTRLRLRAAGYQTLEAEDGRAGLQLARELSPNAIILDLRMPEMNGYETMAALQASPVTRDIPIVVASACPRDESEALDCGAQYFVRKPYAGDDLLDAVKASVSHCLTARRNPTTYTDQRAADDSSRSAAYRSDPIFIH